MNHSAAVIEHSLALPDADNASMMDYIRLLKPRVMMLVVFTSIVGMILAPGEIHPFIAIVAILCITMGSGASGAINMWIERHSDGKMERTKNRPLPQGRIHADNALEFAVVLAVLSVTFMALIVNYLSAILLAAAILFYVFIYTLWLKPRTPQNIVIGGAAGSFPPIIGWAAVTNSITLEPVVLFCIIFMWTPPHFWALALYRCQDYEKAGIPMMPVVAGVDTTKKLILWYTIFLFPLSLVPSFINMAGIYYLISAIVLGMIFLHHAWRVYKQPIKRYAAPMFGYSLFYLFWLFMSLLIDKGLLHYAA